MSYFKIGDVDFSHCVNNLKVNKTHTYTPQMNAAGNTVVDYLNTKHTIEVGIIPLDDAEMMALQNAIDAFNVSISFRSPLTGALKENVNCILPTEAIEYYTIQAGEVLYKAFTLTFTEL